LLYAGGANGNYTISGTTGRLLQFNQNGQGQLINVYSGTLTVDAIVGSGSSPLVKTGQGTLVLAKSNSVGGVRVYQGVVRATNNGALSATSVSVQNGAALELANSVSIGALPLSLTGTGVSSGGALRNVATTTSSYAGAITMGTGGARINSDTGTLTLTGGVVTASGNNVTFGGAGNTTVSTVAISGGGGLVKDGAGTTTLSFTNSYTGATAINGGTLQLGNGGSTGALTGTASITNNGNLIVNRSNDFTQATDLSDKVIGGSGSFTQAGAGTTTLSRGNTYTGATTISGGTLQLGNGGSFGALTGTASIANSGSLIVNRSNTFTQATDLNDKVIGGSGAFAQAGAGTTILSLANTYTGATTISGGTLRITGSGSINDSSGVTLNGGQLDYNSAVAMTAPLTFTSGTLGGTSWTGSALNNLTIGTNRTISPGNSPGTAATVDQTWATGGTYRFEINSVAGSAGSDPGWDLLAGTGTLTITATSVNPFVIDLTSLDTSNNPNPVFNFDETQSYAWQIADFANPIAGFDASAFFVRPTNFGNAYTGTFSVSPGTSVSGGDNTQLYVTYVAVPEPTTMAILGVGVAFLGRRIARSLAPRRACPG
jgi:autotransporter-associated beta strand protein